MPNIWLCGCMSVLPPFWYHCLLDNVWRKFWARRLKLQHGRNLEFSRVNWLLIRTCIRLFVFIGSKYNSLSLFTYIVNRDFLFLLFCMLCMEIITDMAIMQVMASLQHAVLLSELHNIHKLCHMNEMVHEQCQWISLPRHITKIDEQSRYYYSSKSCDSLDSQWPNSDEPKCDAQTIQMKAFKDCVSNRLIFQEDQYKRYLKKFLKHQ